VRSLAGLAVRPAWRDLVVDERSAVDLPRVTFRTSRCRLLASLLAWAALATPAAASAATPCADANLMPTKDNVAALRDATLCLLNAQRSTHGLKILTPSPQLRKVAQSYSQAMVRQRFFDHVSPGGTTLLSRVRRGTTYLSGVRDYSLGENIGWGSGEYATPGETVKGWMESSAHRANILNRRFRHIGIGVAIGAPEDTQGMPAATYTTDMGHHTLR
jgi:uncharacterized protein YkwD